MKKMLKEPKSKFNIKYILNTEPELEEEPAQETTDN